MNWPIYRSGNRATNRASNLAMWIEPWIELRIELWTELWIEIWIKLQTKIQTELQICESSFGPLNWATNRASDLWIELWIELRMSCEPNVLHSRANVVLALKLKNLPEMLCAANSARAVLPQTSCSLQTSSTDVNNEVRCLGSGCLQRRWAGDEKSWTILDWP